MSIGLWAHIPYRILQLALILISTGFTAKCIQKFILVTREKNNPLNVYKRLFWGFAIFANGTLIIFYIIGVSGDELANSRFRIFGEICEVTPAFLLLFMQITTLIIIEESVKMANGKGSKEVNWWSFLVFISLPLFISLTHFLFIGFTFFTNVICDNKQYTREEVFQATFNFKAFYYTEGYFNIFANIWNTIGVLEGVLFLLIMVRLMPVLEIVYEMMKKTDRANKVKKTKLKEWVIFITLCTFVAFTRSVIAMRFAYEDIKGLEGEDLWVLNEKTLEDQKKEADNPTKRYFWIDNYDISHHIMGITVGVASAFIAPCRKIKRN